MKFTQVTVILERFPFKFGEASLDGRFDHPERLEYCLYLYFLFELLVALDEESISG